MATAGRYCSTDPKGPQSGASSLIGNLIAVMIVILIAGIVFFYLLGFHLVDKPDVSAYSVRADNASALKITCMAGNSIPMASINMLLNGSRIGNYVLADSNKDGRWDPGEIVYASGVDLSKPRQLTITSNTYVLYTTMVQYLGIANNSSAGPQYASGLIATYYSDEGWTTPAATRISRVIQYADDGSIGTYPSVESHWPTAELSKTEYFSVQFSGLLKIDKEDNYTFYLTSDDGSYLAIDGTQVISNGGLHSATEKRGTVHLTPGYHDIDVKMYNHAGLAVAELEYSAPSMSRQYVQALYHVPTGSPTAAFTGSPRGAPAPLQVRFTDQSFDATGWQWDFGDGTTSTEQNPVHTYASTGSYTVKLTATNSKGSDTKTMPAYILAGGGSPGYSVTYYSDETWGTAAGSETLSEIKLADAAAVSSGYASDRANWPAYSIGKSDQFSVACEGSLLVDTEADYTFYLTSDDGSYLTIDGTQVINNGGLHSATEKQGTVHLTAGYHDIQVKMYEHTGLAVLRLEYSSPTMARQYVTSVYHVPSIKPVADFTAAPRLAPAPATVQFTDASTDAASWHWDFGDGTTSTVRSPVHTYATPGTYTVALTATNDVGSDTKTAAGFITAGTGTQGFKATYYSDENWGTASGSETLGEIKVANPSSGYASDKANWPSYIASLGRDTQFSARFTGSLNVGTEADYTFYLTSDDGSYLSVDGAQVVDNGGLHSPAEKQGTVHLTPGYHEVEVKMFQHYGLAVARLEYSSPSMARKYVQDVYNA